MSGRSSEDSRVSETSDLRNDLNSNPQATTSLKNDGDEMEEEIPYSVYAPRDKKLLLVLCATVGLWSTISMPIYFPLLPIIKKKFNIDDELMNLAVVLYMIFQGIGPTFVGNLADMYGRRPLVMTSLIGYIGSNIGLAVSDAYWLILVLRCVQAASVAPVIALSSGIVGDITKREERGSFMGVVGGIQLMGQGFGALIGAALASSLGWRSIFWFLAICGGVVLTIVAFALPETRRTIAGNGSIKPKKLINKAPILSTPYFRNKILLNQLESLEPTTKDGFNVFLPFIMLSYPEVISPLFCVAMLYTAWTVALTEYTTILSDKYHYSTMKVGICYLPSGIGSLIGALTSGKVLDFAYRRKKKAYDDISDQNTKPDFNIIEARCSLYYYPVTLFSLFSLVFGWTLDRKVNIAAPLVSSFFSAFFCMFPMTMAQTVLVDMFPTKASTSISMLNLTRCLIGALFVGVLSKMLKAMTVGGTFTFLAALCMLSNLLIYILIKKGKSWILQREMKEKVTKEDDHSSITQREDDGLGNDAEQKV